MKLRKNTGIKAAIVAATAALFAGLLALIQANPGVNVEASDAPQAAPTTQPLPDYEHFFRRDGREGEDDRDEGRFVPRTQSQPPSTTTLPPHTRTRGS